MLEATLSFLITAAMISAIYALVAIGFTMIFGVGGVLNLAHGGLLMIGAYAFLVVTSGSVASAIAIPPVAGLVVAGIVTAILSYVLYAGLVRYIEENVVITFLVTVVVAVLLAEFASLLFSPSPRSLINFAPGSLYLEAVGVRILHIEIVGFALSWVLIGALWYYITQTDRGRSILATSMTERGAKLTGVNIGHVKAQTWVIAGGLAGIAGVFLGTLQETSPVMWLDPLALAFIIVVIGGIGSIKGSLVAAYLIGFLETATVGVFGPEFRGLLSLVIVVGVILVRPEGLYGREFIHE